MEDQEPIDEVFLKRFEELIKKEQLEQDTLTDVKSVVRTPLKVMSIIVIVIPVLIGLFLKNTSFTAYYLIIISAIYGIFFVYEERLHRPISRALPMGSLKKDRKRIYELENALAKVKSELAKLQNKKSANAMKFQLATMTITEECDHWHALLKIHTRYIRQLELRKAELGIIFPVIDNIELEERTTRITELQQQIAANCA